MILEEKEHLKGIVLFILTSILWSSSGVLIKMIDWKPIAIAGVRSGIAALVLFPVAKNEGFKFTRLSKDNIFASLSFSITVILFVTATKVTTAANAIILQYTAPIYTILLSGFFLKEKSKPRDYLFSIIIITGIVLCFIDKVSAGSFFGNLMGLFSGVSFSWFYIFMRKQKKSSPINSAFLGNILTFMLSIPFLFGEKLVLDNYIFLIFLGIFQMGIPMLFYSSGIKRISAVEAISISTIEPILNPVWTYLGIDELPGKWTIIGGSLVVTSIFFQSILNIRPSKES